MPEPTARRRGTMRARELGLIGPRPLRKPRDRAASPSDCEAHRHARGLESQGLRSVEFAKSLGCM